MSAESSEVFAPTSLTDIFKSGQSETAAPVTTEAPKDDKPAGDPAAASPSEAQAEVKGKEAPKGEAESDKPKQSRDEQGRFTKTDEEIKALRTAMQEERRKRQDLEARIAKQAESATPKKDFFEDPEGALNERDAKLRAESDERFFKLCERSAKARHADYDEVVSRFFEDAKDDPALAHQVYSQVRSADDPAQFLYNAAKIRSELKSVGGDLAKYREGVESPLKAQIAERDAKIKELETQLANLGKLSPSLNAEQSSTRAQVEADAAAPTPLDDIFNRKKQRRA